MTAWHESNGGIKPKVIRVELCRAVESYIPVVAEVLNETGSVCLYAIGSAIYKAVELAELMRKIIPNVTYEKIEIGTVELSLVDLVFEEPRLAQSMLPLPEDSPIVYLRYGRGLSGRRRYVHVLIFGREVASVRLGSRREAVIEKLHDVFRFIASWLFPKDSRRREEFLKSVFNRELIKDWLDKVRTPEGRRLLAKRFSKPPKLQQSFIKIILVKKVQ